METKNSFYIKEDFTMKSAFKKGFGYMAGLFVGMYVTGVAIKAVDEKLPEKFKQYKKKDDEKKEA